MAFIHPHSCECVKSELDLFSVPPTQTSIEAGAWIEYNPISSLADGTPIEFTVGGSGQDYIDLASTQLYVQAQVLRANDAAIDDTNLVAPTNLFMHSLFSEVDVKLNDTLVTSTTNMYPYRAYLETLLSYGPAAKKSQLTCAMYYKDSAGQMEACDPTADPVVNAGMVRRHGLIAASRVVDMIGPLHNDLFFQDKFLPNDVTIRVRLICSKNSFCLMSGEAGAAYKVKILSCKLLVRKAKINASVFLAHAKAVELNNFRYPLRRAITKSFTIARGHLTYSQEAVISGQLPTRLVVGLVSNSAFNGAFAENPYNFKNYDLTQLKVTLDGQQSQIRPIETNFATHQYVNAYMSLFSGLNKQGRDEGTDIERTDYPSGYTLYALNLTPDLGETSHFQLTREGSLRIDLRFNTPLPVTVNVVVYCEFENVLEVDRNRSVLFDFTN